MSRFEDANNRLLAALERLERAAGERLPAAGDSGARGSGPGNVELDDLRQALDASRRANAALRESRDAVASRIDATIDRLKTVLGE